MTLSVPLLGSGIAMLWLGVLASTRTRNWRFVGLLAAVSIIAINLAFLGGTVGRVAAIVILALPVAALIWPVRFHLSSLTDEDLAADQILRSLEQTLDDSQGRVRVPPALATEPFANGTESWKNAGRLYRLYLARLAEPESTQLRPGTTVIWGYRRAARHYWEAALRQRVIGRHPRPSEWDEDVLLRCLSEEFDRSLPGDALGIQPIVSSGSWRQEAERLLNEIGSARFRYPRSVHRQRLLVEARRTTLALALGDRSEGAIDKANAAASAVGAWWSALAGSDTDEEQSLPDEV